MSKENNLGYDIIIEKYIMKELGIIFAFNNEKLIWGDVILTMWISEANQPKNTLNRALIKQFIQKQSDTKVTRKETETIKNKYIYSQYKIYKLEDISQSSHKLVAEDQVMILHLLKYFKYVFGGILENRIQT